MGTEKNPPNFSHFKTEIGHDLYTLKETRNKKKKLNYFKAFNLFL